MADIFTTLYGKLECGHSAFFILQARESWRCAICGSIVTHVYYKNSIEKQKKITERLGVLEKNG